MMVNVEQLKKQMTDLEQRILQGKVKYELLMEEKNKREQELQNIQKQIDIFDKVRIFLLELGAYQREQVKQKIQSMVTQALQFVLEEDIYFEIVQEEKRCKIWTEFYIRTVKDGIETRTVIEEARGDGILDIVTLALNLMFLILSQGNNTFIILDEPCKQLSLNYINRVGIFLQEISKTYDVQIIMITHNQELAQYGDKIYKISINNGYSQVESL